MAIQAVDVYDHAYDVLFSTTDGVRWDDTTAGKFMWALAADGNAVIDLTDTTGTLVGSMISAGDGVPINVTDNFITQTAGITYFEAGSAATVSKATWGTPVTISARYLVMFMVAVAGTYTAATAKPILVCDLTGTASNESSTAAEFTVNMPSGGWFKMALAA